MLQMQCHAYEKTPLHRANKYVKTLKTDALGSPSLLPRRASILGLIALNLTE